MTSCREVVLRGESCTDLFDHLSGCVWEEMGEVVGVSVGVGEYLLYLLAAGELAED